MPAELVFSAVPALLYVSAPFLSGIAVCPIRWRQHLFPHVETGSDTESTKFLL